MRVIHLSSLFLSLVLGAAPPRFTSQPDVLGEKVVFTYDGDLWLGSLQGGPARRITTHPGLETNARFSPDGRWIAFTGSYDGTPQVYLMPAEGGEPQRLTWRGPALVQSWSPDGKEILFRASYESKARPVTRLYAVNQEGHEPRALPLARGIQGRLAADAHRLAYVPQGDEEYYWKRYKGGQHTEIWLCDLKAGTHQRLTDYTGKNAHPIWAGDKLLFVSDREPSGVANLYQLDLATKQAQALTRHQDFDVQWPSSDGKTVVYVQGGQLHVLDLASGQSRKLEISAPSDAWKTAPRTLNPREWIQATQPTTDGKHAILETRGEIVLVSSEGTPASRNLTKTPGARERFPQLSPDGNQIAYISDESGNYDLYVRSVQGGPARRLSTGLTKGFYRLEWSPDGEKILFGDPSFAIHVMDVASGKLKTLDRSKTLKNDQFTWEVFDYTWSPDSRWVAYSFVEENRNNRIWMYQIDSDQKIAVTDGFSDCLNPCFDPEGRNLYFLSYSHWNIRLDPSQDNYIQPTPVQIMSLQLKATESKAFGVDSMGLQERISVLPIKPGNHFHLRAAQGMLLWNSIEGWDDNVCEEVFRPRGQDKWKVGLYDLKSGKESQLSETVSEWSLDPTGSHILIKKGGQYHLGSMAQLLATRALPGRLQLDQLRLRVDPKAEWAQIFQDTWRWYRDFFYDPHMHGRDWKAIGDKFQTWLPECTSRQDLNWLLSQMVGELCVSHTYVYGGDTGVAQAPPNPVFTGLLGADLKADPSGRYRFNCIYGPTPYERNLKAPLADPAPKVKEGEYLLAIDGVELKVPKSIDRHLQVVRGQKVKLTVNGKPSLDGARIIEVEPLASDRNLRYERWIADNIAQVERLSQGQLGYMHITAMGDQNLGEFDKYWRAFRYRKGLVVDVRGNGGGWTEYFMIDKLERRQVGFNTLRDMSPFRYPGSASDGRYVFIGDEQTASDGEAFLQHVQAQKLGTFVGLPTWGGLVGIINQQKTIDGGFVEQSNNGFYGAEGKWWVENTGAIPDVRVQNDPVTGADHQLETAVKHLLQELKDKPTPAWPAIPTYPKR